MERLEPVHPMVNRRVFLIAFGASPGGIGNPVHRVRAGDQPSGGVKDPRHVFSQGKQFVGILQLLEKQVSFLRQTPPEFLGVVLAIVGTPKFFPIVFHISSFLPRLQSLHTYLTQDNKNGQTAGQSVAD